MAFGGLTGLGPEAIRRLMANPSGIPFGPLNFDPSQMGSLMGGPAFPSQFGPTPAMQAMAPSWGPGQIPMSPNSPYLPPMRGGGPSMGGVGGATRALPQRTLSRSHLAAQKVFDALRGTAGTEAIPMRSGAQILPNVRALTPPGGGSSLTGAMGSPPAWNDFFEMRGRNGVSPMRPAGAPAFPIDPVQYAEGATSRFPAGPSSAYPRVPNPTVNGPGAYPTPAPSAATRTPIPGRGVGPALPQRTPGATLGGSGTSAVTNAAVNQVDDAVRMSAMQMPRPPVTNPAAALGPSVTPVSIRSASPATQTLMQRLFPTVSSWRNGAGLGGRLRNFATGPGLARGIGRGVVGTIADRAIGQPLADQIGDVNGVAGDFASGFSTGAGYGFGFGPAGALVGGLGVGIGNMVTGGGVSDLLSGGEAVAADIATGNLAPDDAARIEKSRAIEQFREGDAAGAWETLGVSDPETIDLIRERFNELAPNASEEERAQLLTGMVDEAIAIRDAGLGDMSPDQIESAQTGGMALDPQSILALQAQAAGLMAPIAADAAAIGDMGHTALSRLANGLPPDLAQAVMGMAQGHQQEGQNSANTYMQQAYAYPQLAALNQQNAMTQQIAQQLQQQAIQSLPQFAQSGGGSFEDIIAAQALGGGTGTGVDGDIAAMLQAAG